MGWRDLLSQGSEITITLPWTGGRSLRSGERVWSIEGKLPREHGWYEWKVSGRKAYLSKTADPAEEPLFCIVRGYLIGDRLIADGANVNPEPAKISEQSESV